MRREVKLITVLEMIGNQHHITYSCLRHPFEAQHDISVIILFPSNNCIGIGLFPPVNSSVQIPLSLFFRFH